MQGCFGKSPAPLFMVSSRLAERGLQLPQEINIPDITSSQLGSQGSSWEPSKQGVGPCSFAGTQLRILSLGDPKKPFQTNKRLLGKLVAGNPGQPVQPYREGWSQQIPVLLVLGIAAPRGAPRGAKMGIHGNNQRGAGWSHCPGDGS